MEVKEGVSTGEAGASNTSSDNSVDNDNRVPSGQDRRKVNSARNRGVSRRNGTVQDPNEHKKKPRDIAAASKYVAKQVTRFGPGVMRGVEGTFITLDDPSKTIKQVLEEHGLAPTATLKAFVDPHVNIRKMSEGEKKVLMYNGKPLGDELLPLKRETVKHYFDRLQSKYGVRMPDLFSSQQYWEKLDKHPGMKAIKLYGRDMRQIPRIKDFVPKHLIPIDEVNPNVPKGYIPFIQKGQTMEQWKKEELDKYGLTLDELKRSLAWPIISRSRNYRTMVKADNLSKGADKLEKPRKEDITQAEDIPFEKSLESDVQRQKDEVTA